MTGTWRIISLAAAALVGALAVVIVTPHPDPPARTLTATDIGFARDMSMHHQQAITMSDMVATDASPEVRALANRSNSPSCARSDR